MSDDLSTAPVPDHDRLVALSVGERDDGSIEVAGPPAAVLSLARWLRAPTDESTAVRGDLRPQVTHPLHLLALDVAAARQARLAVDGSTLTIRASAADLEAIAAQVEVVGVGALDIRWAPVERRTTVDLADRPLVIASAYPLAD